MTHVKLTLCAQDVPSEKYINKQRNAELLR